jgi:pyruvate/2-oxoglutarate dehydrogenase complex dihydrolipoamide acyltransferase (E2) component
MPTLDVMVADEIGDADECVVVTWFKREGDAVQKDEVLLILQAEKVSFEVPAPATGQVTAILAQQGEVVKKGQPLARLELTAPLETPPPASPEPATPVTPPRSAGEAKASPMAKRLAREHQLDLAQVTGSGEGGRITEKDVLAFVEARRSVAPPVGEETAPPPSPPGGMIPLTGIRATIARRMLDSLQRSAQVTLTSEADVTNMVKQREALRSQFDLTYTDLVVKAVALALKEHPRLNAWVVEEEIRLQPDIHLGVAVALEEGLIVPVVREADRKSLKEISQETRRLTQRARDGSLIPAEASGSTFTVTNLGMYGVDAFTPIINPPEVAILGVGRIVERLTRRNGDMLWRQMMTLSLTFDHRAVDGAPAAAFLQTIRDRLEHPDWLYL